MPGHVYRMRRDGAWQGLYRASSGPGDTYTLTPLTPSETREALASYQDGDIGVIEWRS